MAETLNIVRGDLKNKPESTKRLTAFFESIKDHLEGTLYIGYPIIGTVNGGFQIDSLLVSKEHGLVIFHIEEGANNHIDYKEIQDENYTKVQSKLIQHKELTSKRNLAVTVHSVTYAPVWNTVIDPEEEYPCLRNDGEIRDFLKKCQSDEKYFKPLLSVIQSVTSIRKNKARDYIKKDNSRGAKLKALEDSVANLDRTQSSAVIETVDGVQRIRGLAGSGKTIILALKVAYLHAKNPDWKIGVTFNTRSLKEQFRRFIRMFCYEHMNEEPNWSKIDVIHAWGTPVNNSAGIYYNVCQDHNIEYYDFPSSRQFANIYGEEFDKICEKALNEISEFKPKYDLLIIDEAQDFSKAFLKICFNILDDSKRLIYAYDELQSLNKKSMDTPENIFGSDSKGVPLVSLVNEENKPMQDIILYKCYRNPLEILTAAHALGFGIYRNEMVQMFDQSSLWNDIGYKTIKGSLKDGMNVTLKRNDDTSPDFLSNHSSIDDLIVFKTFENNNDQVAFIVSEIEKNLKEDELRLDDIMVINPDPLTTKSVVGAFRKELYERGINSLVAGVTSSPDVFYDEDMITFTGVNRAKGNEAAMVYIINAQYCYRGYELAKKRNILFTSMTRSKAWVRVCGYGNDMLELEKEYKKVVENNFSLTFKYPTVEEREKMTVVNRDMSAQEKSALRKYSDNLDELLYDLERGALKKEDIPEELIRRLNKLL